MYRSLVTSKSNMSKYRFCQLCSAWRSTDLRPQRRGAASRAGLASAGVAILLLTAVDGVVAAQPQPPRMDPRAVTWSTLEFRATKLFLTATAEISLEHLPARLASARLRATSRDDDASPTGPVGHLAVTSKLAGRQSDEEVFFALVDGGTFERRKRQHGRKPYFRSERYTDAGVDGERRRPADGGTTSSAPSSWGVAERRFDAHESPDERRAVVHPLVMFYLVSAGNLDEVGDRLAIDAHADHRFLPIDLEVMEVVPLAVNYSEQLAGDARQRRGTVDALRIEVRDASGSDADLSFLGLENGIEIFVERERRIPILVRGRLGGLGQLDIRLVSATVSAARDPSPVESAPPGSRGHADPGSRNLP